MDGLLLVDKPAGMTSHDVVARVRRLSGERRIGHAGTLDPLATGLLVLLMGRATRLASYLQHATKTYTALIRLGETTTTDDAEGEVLASAPVTCTAKDIRAALAGFLGEQEQVPPAYSAIKVDGAPVYRRARKGEQVTLTPRKVTFYALQLVAWSPPDALVTITCSAGTYVRSLARDLGVRLGCGGHVRALRRETAGQFRVGDALTLEQVAALAEKGTLETALLSPMAALADWPRVTLPPELARAVQHGMRVPLPEPLHAPYVLACDADGRWLAILAPAEAGLWHPDLVWEPA